MVAANDEPKIADFGLALNIAKDMDRIHFHHGGGLAGIHVTRTSQGLSAKSKD